MSSSRLAIGCWLLGFLMVTLPAGASSIRLQHVYSDRTDVTVPVGELLELEAFADIGGLRSGAIEVHVRYDPAMLQILDTTPVVQGIQPFENGGFYQGVELKNDLRGDTLGYSVGVLGQSEPLATGQGVVAKLRFRTLAIGMTSVEFRATPEDWEVGTYTFFTLADGDPRSFRDVEHAQIHVVESVPFNLLAIPDQEIFKGDTARILLVTYLVANPAVVAQVEWQVETEGRAGTEIDPVNQVLLITAPSDWTGTQELQLIATSPDGSVANVQFQIAVLADPSVPVILSPEPQNVTQGTSHPLLLDSHVQDQDTSLDQLTWEVVDAGGLPVSISETRDLVVEPPVGMTGAYFVTMRVTDPEGHQDEAVWEYHILPPVGPTFSISPFEPVEITAGGTVLVDLATHVNSAQIDPVAVIWDIVEVPASLEAAMRETHRLETQASSDAVGQAELQLIATAPDGTTQEISLEFIITQEPQPVYQLVCAVVRNPVASDYLHVLVGTEEGVVFDAMLGRFVRQEPIVLSFRQVQPRLWVSEVLLPSNEPGTVTLEVEAYDASGRQLAQKETRYVLP